MIVAQETTRSTAILALVGLVGVGCKGQGSRVEAAVVEDRKLADEEVSLLRKRGTLQRERGRLRDKRARLVNRKLTLDAADAEGRKQVATEESELLAMEAKLAEQEESLNTRLNQLLNQQSGLMTKLGAAEGKTILMARREYSVASREQAVGRREAELARRERQLANREQRVAERQANLCPKATTTIVTKVAAAQPAAGGRNYSRNDVEPVYHAALKLMRAKGILAADLPPGTDRLITTVRHGVAKKEYSRAKFAADQLLTAVRRMRVNRAFIGEKIGRLSKAIRRRPLGAGSKKAQVEQLFQRATSNYGDGRFSSANRHLNRIYALLH